MKERHKEREHMREAYQTAVKHLRHQESKKMKAEHFVEKKEACFYVNVHSTQVILSYTTSSLSQK